MELWNEIDLSRHGVIEAHAGTGKTFTIVMLVLRILETATEDRRGGRRLIHLRELLLVTFTEKAAGELRKRIREGLETRICRLRSENSGEAAALIEHLEDCLNNLHETLIGTIHAVCLRLLQNRPFESGIHFTTEMVDDTEGLSSCLREIMRNDWQTDNYRIAPMLGILAEFGKRLGEHHFRLILKTARQLLDTEHTLLHRPAPAPVNLPLFHEELRQLLQQREESWPDLRTIAAKLADLLETADAAGRISVDKREILVRRCTDLRKIGAGYRPDVSILATPLKVGTKLIFIRADLKRAPELAEVDECARKLASHPYIAAATGQDSRLHLLILTLISDAAELLAARWNSAKRKTGQLSFLDMLSRMHDAVRDHPPFAASLRERIHYAIIDEFQDTSPTQWAIFRRLFIDISSTDSPRLYIVGDPKQSIYRFQGADVDSYLDARIAIGKAGGAHYVLFENFRSYTTIIDAYNAVFTSRTKDGDWFLSGSDTAGIEYRTGNAVRVRPRSPMPIGPPEAAALQVMTLHGTATGRTRIMAEYAAGAIQHLLGRTISLPDGPIWKNVTLGYEHFAVIVEKHSLADPFLDLFRNHGIPAVKYKMEGVFQSPLAGALLALFNALIAPAGNPAPRTAVLLSHFFNRHPATIDPDHDLEPCPDPACSGDTLCIAHALQEWTALADSGRWARLFESIQVRSGIRERLIRLIDGERHVADLRQLIEYCIEKLYTERFTLRHLAGHLDLVAHEESGISREADLHVLATQKSSVKVLTMHAAKGLEFPVVFVASGTSKTRLPPGPGCIRWDEELHIASKRRPPTNVTPYLSTNDVDFDIGGATPKARALEQERRERRRLLYVALTRAQALLFVPLHCKEPPDQTVPGFKWCDCKLPTNADSDLTPALLALLDADPAQNSIGLFNCPRPKGRSTAADTQQPPAAAAPCPDPTSLELASRICRQTSYSQLSREAAPARTIDRSEEVDDEPLPRAVPSPLPGGKKTGNALHTAIEEILRADDAAGIVNDTGRLAPIVEKCLHDNGVLTRLNHTAPFSPSPDLTQAAIATACTCIHGALTTALPLPEGTKTIITRLPNADRLPEMEFLFPAGKHWVHGFMDLVFRTALTGSAVHPWRYFVLDWKSDTLDEYTHATINRCMEERHYTLQSKLYCHALDRFLRHTLRENYDPGQHLGGAVYVFLRGFCDHSAVLPVIVNAAQPDNDRVFVNGLVFGKDTGTHGI